MLQYPTTVGRRSRVPGVRFSLWTSTEPAWPDLLERARLAESAGLDGVWVADHFMPNSDDVGAPYSATVTTNGSFADPISDNSASVSSSATT